MKNNGHRSGYMSLFVATEHELVKYSPNKSEFQDVFRDLETRLSFLLSKNVKYDIIYIG